MRHDTDGPAQDRSRRHRAVLGVVAAKLAIVALVLVLPTSLAIGLGVAHAGMALVVLVVVLSLVVLRRRRSHGLRGRRPGLADRPHQKLTHTSEAEPMPSAESRIQTQHSSRYLVQLCKHAKKFDNALQHLRLHARPAGTDHPRPRVLQVEWTDTTGTIALSWGTCALHADHDTLTVRIDAADEENLRRVQDLITADLERFGRRDQLTLSWTRPTETTADVRD